MEDSLFTDYDSDNAVAILASAHQATRAAKPLSKHYALLAKLWPGEFSTMANLRRRLERVQAEHRRQSDHRPNHLSLTPITLAEAKTGERLLAAHLGATTEFIQILNNTPVNQAALTERGVQLYRFSR
jgi:hypothetical protein